ASEQMQWYLKNYGRETCLENCIGLEKNTLSSAEKDKKPQLLSWIERAKQMIQTDNQVRECIMLINHCATMRSLSPAKARTRKDFLSLLRTLLVSSEPLIVQEH